MVHSPSERKPFLRLDKPRGLTSRFYDQLIEDLRERLHHTGPFLFWLARIGLATTAAVLLLHQVSLFEKQAPPDCSFSADVHVVVNFLRAAAVYHCIVVFLMFGGQALLLGFASSTSRWLLLFPFMQILLAISAVLFHIFGAMWTAAMNRLRCGETSFLLYWTSLVYLIAFGSLHAGYIGLSMYGVTTLAPLLI